MDFLIPKNAPGRRHNKHWQFCVGSGHAPLALRADYMKMLRFIHDELGICYVRFHGIFNDDMEPLNSLESLFPLKGAERFRELNFRKIACVYDNILDCGMKPFVELSFMPKLLASGDKQCFFYYKGNITPPADYGEWSRFIETFMRFLIGRYGETEVRSWYFEVWNEPDLWGFFSGTKEEYFKLYQATAEAIKAVDVRLRVGGPSTSASKWIHGFLSYCRENSVPVDFVSTHQYAGDPVGMIDVNGLLEQNERPHAFQGFGSADLLKDLPDGDMLDALRYLLPDKSETTDIPDNVFRDNAAIVKKQARGLPVFYTEWNVNSTFSAYTNDTRKPAAYIVRAALDTEGNIDRSSIWCFSDLFEEFHNFPQEFHGGFGLLTNNGIPKPSFYALKLLDRLTGLRLDLGGGATAGEIGIAAFRDEKTLQILLFRQKMKNVRLEPHEAVITVETDERPLSAAYMRIDETHCNPLRVWEEMGRPDNLTRAEVKRLTEQTGLTEEPLDYAFSDGYARFSVKLGVNDVYLITVNY
ncbi:MAG: hypothetical protein LBS19_04080 [Clostridiales bacterium]|jgi:xylan 1,4-beta-xylosidase|nr:hypothetical protein [Clostridiales bacterium]